MQLRDAARQKTHTGFKPAKSCLSKTVWPQFLVFQPESLPFVA
jgi:hypothetical protein